MMSTAEVVTVQHLVKSYGNVFVVNDISFSIREGEIFGIIGPNGAGKTTSVECISGLRAPDAGSISVCGLSPRDVQKQGPSVGRCPVAGERTASAAQGGGGSAALRLVLLEPAGPGRVA